MADTAAIPIDRLVRIYTKMRAKLQELDQEVERIKEEQKAVKLAIKDQMQTNHLTSAKTEFGTVSLVTKTRFYTQDWDSFKAFMKEHDALDLMERRISQTNMKTFLEEHPTLMPPGLNSETEFDISVRKVR